MTLTGGCFCKAVRYRITAPPLASGICHCESCRRASSAPVLPFLGVAEDAFAFTQGAPAEYSSSPGVTRGFCARCGALLTYRRASEAGRLDVMTCSLDDPETAPPRFHVWVSDGLTWARPGADGRPAFATTRQAGDLAPPIRRG